MEIAAGNTRLTFTDNDANGYVDFATEVLQENHYYLPSSRDRLFGLNTNPDSYRDWVNDVALDNKYQYNGKEFNDDFGLNLNDYGARWYDAAIARFPIVDPLGSKMQSWSPYNYVLCRPVNLTDNSGMAPDGIIVDEKGNTVGNDGKADGKMYVIKTQQKDFGNGVSGAGLSKKEAKATKEFVSENSGNSSAFDQNPGVYNNMVEVEGQESTRQAMVDEVNKDNGKAGTSDENNREYSGQIKSDGSVVPDPAGPVSTPFKGAEVERTISADTKSTFHSHPSGTATTSTSGSTNDSMFGGTTSYGGTSKTTPYNQPPSRQDVINADSNVRYVFGMGNQTTYIYNGSGVQATLPTSSFVKPK